jgi:hypothetical protein
MLKSFVNLIIILVIQSTYIFIFAKRVTEVIEQPFGVEEAMINPKEVIEEQEHFVDFKEALLYSMITVRDIFCYDLILSSYIFELVFMFLHLIVYNLFNDVLIVMADVIKSIIFCFI